MFKIQDGRKIFYQWDTDRKLIVEDGSINQVHFCNRTDDCSLVCEVYDQDGLRLVDVPNILLQDIWRINVYGFDSNYTKHSQCFDIYPRTKPDTYVYTETETLNYNTLLERLNDVDENIAFTVQEYLEMNPPEVDLGGYATEDYVDEMAESLSDKIEFTTVRYISEVPEHISNYAAILVTSIGNNPTDVTWTDSLLIMRGYFNYGAYGFCAVDGAGAWYQGSIDLRDNSIGMDLVDSLESKASKEYVDEAVGNVDIPDVFTGATGYENGSAGLVPAPMAEDESYFLCANGTWQSVGFLQIATISNLPYVLGRNDLIFVSDNTDNPTGTEWTGTLLITRGSMSYGVYSFTAIDSAGAFFKGSVDMRNNTISMQLVDSLADKATIAYVDEAIEDSGFQTEEQVIALIQSNMPASGDEVSY